MSGWVLYDQTLILLNSLEDMRLLNRPLADICPFFGSLRVFLLRMRGFPACFPVVCELFEEICFDIGRLRGLVGALSVCDHACAWFRVRDSYGESGLLND